VATRSKAKRQLKMQAAVQSPALAKTVPRPFELSAPPAPSTAEIAKAGHDTTRAMEPVGALKAAPRPTVPATAMAFQNSPPTFMKALGRPARRQSLWSIGVSNGVLERSDDGGKTWTAIPVGGQTNFLAVSVSGPDIWAGNESGALFHSTDDGSDWKEVRIADGSERLRDSITGIETQGSQVKVRTKSGNWVSADGGVTWRKMGE
jgi:photosystem II stability/assembly factor-like uncharacterized protein